MSVIKIEDFGGEQPSLSPRALGANAAQRNVNLVNAVSEFRPVRADLFAAHAPTGTRTMHRFSRAPDGAINTQPASGWILSSQPRSYVKGQINDERTERTFFTADDGSQPPRAIDVHGADRRLGVPRPVRPAVTLAVSDELTPEEANTFLYGEATEQIRQAVAQSVQQVSEPGLRFSGSTIFAGPTSSHGLLFPNNPAVPSDLRLGHWNLYGQVPIDRARLLGLEIASAGSAATATHLFLPLTALPAAHRLDIAAIANRLRTLQLPEGAKNADGQSTAGTQMLSEGAIGKIIEAATRAVDVALIAKEHRDELEAVTREFARLLNTAVAIAVPPAPVEPTKPTVPEFSSVFEDGRVRNPEWVAYDTARAQFMSAQNTHNEALFAASSGANSLNTKLQELQNRARIATHAIEAAQLRAWAGITGTSQAASALVDELGGVGEFLPNAASRIIDTRFYIVTFVTDWGEESEPSEPSEMLEPDQNDLCSVARPGLTTGEAHAARHIVKWRLYRSSTGNESSTFRLVDEMLVGTLAYTDAKKGAELGEVCPTLTWTEPPYRMDGQADGWPKPVVGTNPFLRGLTGMPNGIMAGFLDNTVAFCEPYVPYAWPAEYQVVIEYPIVGLGVFDNTLFVGTIGSPYFITGSDSATMSAQKVDSNQACVSARSIASVQGGVLFASPDGLCLASANGVNLITQRHFTREDWQQLNPASMQVVEHEGVCFVFFDNGSPGCLAINLAAGKLGRVDLSASAVFVDKQNDVLYVASGASILAAFAGAAHRTGVWRTARRVFPEPVGFAWVHVFGEQTTDNPAIVRWIADGQLRHEAVLTDTSPKRLPSGRWAEHEVEVESRARITSVMLASSTAELQQI